MKKWVVAVCCLAVGIVVGCFMGSGNTPESAAKAHVEELFSGLEVDLSGLTYTVKETGDDTATVTVEGTIPYTSDIALAKKDGDWQLAVAATEPEPPAEVTLETEPREADTHEAQPSAHETALEKGH